MDPTSIPIWVPLTIACGISVWALLSVLGSERQRRQLSQPMQVVPSSPSPNATSNAKPTTKEDPKKPGRVAA